MHQPGVILEMQHLLHIYIAIASISKLSGTTHDVVDTIAKSCLFI